MDVKLQFTQLPDHEAFFWPAGEAAALLIHGFPGTPAEMRPLAKLIRDCGWSVSGLLLPGFGADIGTLEQRRYTDWTKATSAALVDLQRTHSPVVVIGFSVGGSIALHAAIEHRPDGVVLLAPFWSLGNRWVNLAWPAIARLRPRLHLLRHTDFTSPEERQALQGIFGAVDLDNAEVQEQIRQLSVPSRSVGEVLQLGKKLAGVAGGLTAPALVIQGTNDQITVPHRTRNLISRFAQAPRYHEVDGGHDLISPAEPSWSSIARLMTEFLDFVAARK
jgi:carboxylesterase